VQERKKTRPESKLRGTLLAAGFRLLVELSWYIKKAASLNQEKTETLLAAQSPQLLHYIASM
jgi:hypothetical protein